MTRLILHLDLVVPLWHPSLRSQSRLITDSFSVVASRAILWTCRVRQRKAIGRPQLGLTKPRYNRGLAIVSRLTSSRILRQRLGLYRP